MRGLGEPPYAARRARRGRRRRASGRRAKATGRALGTANIHFHRELVALAGSARTDELMRSVLAELRLAFHVVDDPRRLHEPYLARNRQILRGAAGRRRARAPSGCSPSIWTTRWSELVEAYATRASAERRGASRARTPRSATRTRGRQCPDHRSRPRRFGRCQYRGPNLCTVTSPASTDRVPPQLSAGPRPAPGPAADEGLARRLRALACTAPLHDLDARKANLAGEYSVYAMAEVALAAIDLVTLNMDFDTGADHDQIVARLLPAHRRPGPAAARRRARAGRPLGAGEPDQRRQRRPRLPRRVRHVRRRRRAMSAATTTSS